VDHAKFTRAKARAYKNLKNYSAYVTLVVTYVNNGLFLILCMFWRTREWYHIADIIHPRDIVN
jgi:hypothetical protein